MKNCGVPRSGTDWNGKGPAQKRRAVFGIRKNGDIPKQVHLHTMGPRKAGRRRCAVQVFSPEAKTLAQPELTSGEH